MDLTYKGDLLMILSSIVSIVFIYFLFRRIKALMGGIWSLVKWVKPSFEDTNGHSSSRRLTAFAVVVTYICCRVSYANAVTDPYYLLAGLIVDALFTLLLFGIVTFQQVLALKESLKSGNSQTPVQKEDKKANNENLGENPEPLADPETDPKKM